MFEVFVEFLMCCRRPVEKRMRRRKGRTEKTEKNKEKNIIFMTDEQRTDEYE